MQNSDSIPDKNLQTGIQWEWKSNQNPYSQLEEAEWTPYEPHENDLLEKAYQDDQKEVDLGDYIISIKDMLQKRKDNIYKQRPIRRNVELSEDERIQEENLRAERFFGAETPKTFNDVFGDLSAYLKFFQNRGPEIQKFGALINDIETSNNLDLLNDTVQPCIIKSIQDEAKEIPTTSRFRKQYENKLLLLFEEAVMNIKEFYAKVLKAYTMAGWLYQNLNRYLRNEDWTELESLLPYAYCLCKAFLHEEFASNPVSKSTSMTVYRGAQFDEAALSFYDPNMIKNFGWNGVTSTSTKLEVAEKFMGLRNDPKKPISVMFIIEVPLSPHDVHRPKWIDIKPYSALPNEDEVVLPPGSVFELVGISRDKNVANISLKLLINVDKLAHQGQIMHGALHSEMTNDKSFKFVCLDEKELTEAIAHLKGNQIIEEFEFCLCKFDEKVGVSLSQTLENTPRVKSLVFISPQNLDWSLFFEPFSNKNHIEKLEIIESNIDSQQQDFSFLVHLPSLKSLNLNFPDCSDKLLNNFCSQGGFKNLTSFSLYFKGCTKITTKGFDILSQNLPHLLTSLSLNFKGYNKIKGEGLTVLSQHGLKNLTSLTSLDLALSQITDEGLSKLSSQGLKNLTSLNSLSLDFSDCFDITDKGLLNLNFQGLSNLTSLDLDFSKCSQITEEGIHHLSSQQGLKNLTSLTSLALDFSDSDKMTNQVFHILGQEALKDLASLTSLTLKFNKCHQISDEGLNILSQEILQNLPLLTNLSLSFNSHYSITDHGLHYLCSRGITHLTSLTSLSLSFHHCSNITDFALLILTSQRHQCLTKITSLNLDFSSCGEMTNEALNILSQGLEYVKALQSLNLNFHDCKNLTDEGLSHLISLKQLPSLASVALDFTRCKKVTSKGSQDIQKLLRSFQQSSTGDHHFECITFERVLEEKEAKIDATDSTSPPINVNQFPSLEEVSLFMKKRAHYPSWTLNFEKGQEITIEGLTLLCQQSLQNLSSLTSLTLNFPHCKISDNELTGLFQHCPQNLTSLNLDLSYCEKLTGKGFNHFSWQNLTCLTLNFTGCDNLTDEALHDLFQQGLSNIASLKSFSLDLSHCGSLTGNWMNNSCWQKLSQLTTLTLNFKCCYGFTDDALINFTSNGLKFLASLTSLTLDLFSCQSLTDAVLKNWYQQEFKQLESLTLKFAHCFQMTDDGLIALFQQGFRNLPSLKSLNLDMTNWENFTGHGLNNSCWQEFIQLTSLILNFTDCKKLTDEALLDFSSKRLRNLTLLTSLTLNFSNCSQISDETINAICSQGIQYLTSLTSLSLNFSCCNYKITDQALINLSSQGLQHLTHLTSLSLNFDWCRITDEGLNSLSSQGLKPLVNLTSLALYFGYSEAISDKGLNYLCSKGIKYLARLRSLTVDFTECLNIKEIAWKNLCKVLKYFGYQPCTIAPRYPTFKK